MAIVKTEVVSVRVEPRIKAALLAAAGQEMRSLANMVEVMVVAYCGSKGIPVEAVQDRPLSTASRQPS